MRLADCSNGQDPAKEKEKLRNSNSQLQPCKNDLKPSMCALKETTVLGSHSAEPVENWKQNLILWLAELQGKLIFQSCSVSTIKVKHWLEKNGIF